MIRPLVDYSDNDDDVEEEEEYVNNSNIADEEIWGTGKRIEKLITVKCVEKHTHHLGKGGISKSDEFLEKFQKGGGGHFQSKNLCCRFLPL